MVALCLLVLLSQDTADKEVDALVDLFRSDRIEERERAFLGLKALGVPALGAVEELTRDADFEIAFRARELLPALGLRGWIAPRFLAVFPAFAKRLGRDDAFARDLADSMPQLAQSFQWDEGWNGKLFLHGFALAQRFPEEVSMRELEPMAGAAFRDTLDDDERLYLCGIVEATDLRSALPEIRELAGSGNPALREAVVTALSRLLAAEALPEIIPFLDDPAENVRVKAFLEVEWNGPTKAVAPLIRLLEGKLSPDARIRALALLLEAGSKEALPAIRARLKDEDAGVRRQAVTTLAHLAAAEARPDLERLLDDPDESVQITVLRCLGEMDIRDAGPAILGRLRAPSLRVRQEAIFTLMRIGDRRDAGSILPLLKDESLRQTAILALGVLEAKDALAEIRAYADSGDPYVRGQAALAIRRLEGAK